MNVPFFFLLFYFPRILYIPTVGDYFYSQEKRPHSLIVKCVSRGNLEIDSLLLTLCCHCVYSSCIFVGLHRRTHFTDYLCDRPLQKMGRWKLLSKSTSAVVCPAEMQGCPESTQSHALFCWKMFPLLNQNLQSRWNLDGLFGAGVADGTQTSGAAFWFIPECGTLRLWVWASGFTGCDFSGGKPGAYLCLFVFQCCNLPSSCESLFY